MEALAPRHGGSDRQGGRFGPRFGLTGALLTCVSALPACGGEPEDFEIDIDEVAEVEQAIGYPGDNNRFTISEPGGQASFAGQWELYPGWKTHRLNGQDKCEHVSSCLLSLLNGNDLKLALCIVGPGGSPFSDACTDPNITLREGGFFGDLFATNPTAYVAGPDTADPVDSGRACFGSQGNDCCAEGDANCPPRIVLAGAILGSPEQDFANNRCNAAIVKSANAFDRLAFARSSAAFFCVGSTSACWNAPSPSSRLGRGSRPWARSWLASR